MQYTIQPPTGAVVQVLLYLLWKNNAEEEVQTDEKENFNDTFKEKNFLEWQKHDHNAKKRFKKKVFSVEVIIDTIKSITWSVVSKMLLLHSRTFTSETLIKKKKTKPKNKFYLVQI